MEPRNSQYVLSKLTNLLSSNEKENVLRQYWMPDDITVECYDCTSKFTSFRRRHHCRVCGQVFCSKCCNSYISGKQIGYNGNLRVCTFCYGFYQNFVEQGRVPAADGTLSVAYHGNRRRSIDDVAAQLSHSPNFGKSTRKVSASVDLYGSTGVDSATLDVVKETNETVILKDPAALARLLARILEPDGGLHLETHRYYFRSYQDTFQGCKLVDWLIDQDNHTSRSQAVAIGQALLTAGFLTAVSNQPVFVDGTELYQPCDRTVISGDTPDSETPEQDMEEPLWLREVVASPFQIEKRTSNSSSQSKLENRHRSGGNHSLKDFKPNQGLQVDICNLRENFAENGTLDTDTLDLDTRYREHEEVYLDRVSAGYNLTPAWRSILQDLADETIRTVTPDLRKNSDDMDIRCYVKVKCVAGGNRKHSRLIPGEVCSLKLTHRKMATQLDKPRIALVANSIVYQRDENRMMALDTLTLQEEEYIKNVTMKLLQSKPNIVLVEKTASRLAQDIFLREGVSLALNVKFRVLERLERLTGGKIITSIDSMMTAPVMGTCQSFYVENPPEEQERRSLLVFDGCSPELGGTIILQGENRSTLVKLKAILKRLLLLKYNWKYERSFILNEYGWISSKIKEEVMEEEDKFAISISPFIKVETRNLEVMVPEGMDVLEEMENEESVFKPSEKDLEKTMEIHPWCEGFIQEKLNQSADTPGVQNSVALFRAAGWRTGTIKKTAPAPVRAKRPIQLPDDHCENLPVLFSSFSSKSCHVYPNFCVVPWVVDMGMYGNYDISLGGFLELFCFNKDYHCPNKQCNTPILTHTRRFCHGGGSISVHMQELEAPIMGEEVDKLMMWKYCTECELITPIVPVTVDTWSLSFAMFLHIIFHENQLTRRGSDRPDAKCSHSLHQEHLTCFGKMDAVTTFKYSKLPMLKLVPPCTTPELPDIKVLLQTEMLEKMKVLKKHGSSIYSDVLETLHEIKGENADIKRLLGQQEEDFKEYRARVEKLEEKICSGTDQGINMLQILEILTRDVIMAQQQWNKRLLSLNGLAPRKKNASGLPASVESSDPQQIKKTDNDTVKKFISTIMPHEKEDLITSPFPPGHHLIITLSGSHLDPPSPILVAETEPSSIIYYLLNTDAYQHFLADESESNQHLELQFSSDTAQFYSCSYFTKEFHLLRNEIFPGRGAEFLASLSTCRRWEAMGGKSGLLFFKTRDDRFILKQMSRFEFQSFTEFAPHYFKYIKQCKDSGTKTLLGKIVGVYKVGYKSVTGTGMKMDLLIIENLFYKKEVDKSYDLKGSVRNRLTVTEGKTDAVLLDENLVRGSCEAPLYINSCDKNLLVEAIKRDTAFLAIHQMMDYSLLAGICSSTGELVVGIIDYIRTFTWDKKLETLVKSVKSSGVFGGPAKTPTVINPEFYRKRFTEAMESYFLIVPD